MVRMTPEEIQQLLDKVYGNKNSNALLIGADESDFTVDADASEAQTSRAANTSHSQRGDEMGTMTVQELDALRSRNRMKERKVPRVQQSVHPIAPSVADTQATHEVVSAPAPSMLRRIWNWLFTAPAASPASTDLITLRREIEDWVKLHHEVERLRNARPKREIARYVFLILTAAFYGLIAYSAMMIGH